MFLKSSRWFGMGSASSGIVGGMDEVWQPSAYSAREALDEEQRWVAPAPTPDGDLGVFSGRVRIDTSPI